MQFAIETDGSTETGAARFASDSRADGGSRRVSMNARRVLIERRVGGIAMRVGVPTKAYAGVVLSIGESATGRMFRISLSHADSDLAVTICECPEQDGIAEWKKWARYFSLPRLIERHDGGLQKITEMIGSVSLGSASPARRRGGYIGKRRPKFLMRRRTGNVSAATGFFGAEREIICYE